MEFTEMKKVFKYYPITEIISENEFFDYEAKYKGQSNEVTPADNLYNLEKRLKI